MTTQGWPLHRRKREVTPDLCHALVTCHPCHPVTTPSSPPAGCAAGAIQGNPQDASPLVPSPAGDGLHVLPGLCFPFPASLPAPWQPWATSLYRHHLRWELLKIDSGADRFLPAPSGMEERGVEQSYPRPTSSPCVELRQTMAAAPSCFKENIFKNLPSPSLLP